MKYVFTFGTGRHKRQADITLLFQYIMYTLVIVCIAYYIFLNISLRKNYSGSCLTNVFYADLEIYVRRGQVHSFDNAFFNP